MLKMQKIPQNLEMSFNGQLNMFIGIITPKCVIIHFRFHYILNEFWTFYLVKLVNPLMNKDELLQTMNCFINT
jgi:uncharacterized protein YhhL (DUF1145 family)